MRLCLVDDVPFERQVFSGLSKLFKSTSRSAGFRYGFVCLPLPVCTCLHQQMEAMSMTQQWQIL